MSSSQLALVNFFSASRPNPQLPTSNVFKLSRLILAKVDIPRKPILFPLKYNCFKLCHSE